MRHLTFLSLSLSLRATALGSLLSSRASRRQLAEGRKMMFSPTLVVSAAGPASSRALDPNLAHVLRSATRWLTPRCASGAGAAAAAGPAAPGRGAGGGAGAW